MTHVRGEIKEVEMDVNNNILSSVKLSLGITDEYTHFDQQIVMCINTVFSTL